MPPKRAEKTDHIRSIRSKTAKKNGAYPFISDSFFYFCVRESNQRRKAMAGKKKSMSLIKQLLLLKKQGFSNRKAAGMVGMDKETVNNYVRKAKADPLGLDGLL